MAVQQTCLPSVAHPQKVVTRTQSKWRAVQAKNSYGQALMVDDYPSLLERSGDPHPNDFSQQSSSSSYTLIYGDDLRKIRSSFSWRTMLQGTTAGTPTLNAKKPELLGKSNGRQIHSIPTPRQKNKK
jgi:hypothetical protein